VTSTSGRCPPLDVVTIDDDDDSAPAAAAAASPAAAADDDVVMAAADAAGVAPSLEQFREAIAQVARQLVNPALSMQDANDLLKALRFLRESEAVNGDWDPAGDALRTTLYVYLNGVCEAEDTQIWEAVDRLLRHVHSMRGWADYEVGSRKDDATMGFANNQI
ncbi:hypothetical protein PMAYCL1PPCAC_04619, partial [Pristionchus mayeri]